MSDLKDLLAELATNDIQLSFEDAQLRISAPKGVMTADLNTRLSANKDALIAHLVAQKSITPAPMTQDYPLSFSQQRLWFVDQLEKDSPAYNMPSAIRLHGTLDSPALEASLNEILRRHKVLRTSFVIKVGKPVQHVHDDVALTLTCQDLTHLNQQEQETTLATLIEEESQHPFDLSCAPLIRTRLLKTNTHEHVLLLSMHHIVSDGWSIGIIGKELSQLYKAFSKKEPSPLPELTLQYGDFSHWQNEWLQGTAYQSQLTFWQQHLEGAPHILDLPTDHARPALQTYNGRTYTTYIDADTCKALQQLTQQSGCTLFTPLYAALALILRAYTAQNDLIIGAPIANRNRPEVEDLIGFFANTLPLRIKLDGNPNVKEWLKSLQGTILAAFENQDIPFEKIVDSLHVERDLSRSPLAQVVFVLQNAPLHASGTTTATLEGLQLEPIPFETGTVRLDMEIHVWQDADRLKVEFIHNRDLFDESTIARMADNYLACVQSLCENADQKLLDIKTLSATEEKNINEGNHTVQSYEHTRCIHHFIEEHAQNTPNAIALACDGQYLSYQELNEKANQLARYIQQQGAKANTPVAVCLNRSIDMIVSLLAVLKCGAAYVPIDPAYPKDRIAYLLHDCSANLLISTSDVLSSLMREEEALTPRTILLDCENNLIAQINKNNVNESVSSQTLAYIIYTSGSTGKPKGVQIRHHSVINLLQGVHPRLNISAEDVWTVFHSYAFDLSVWEIWSPLVMGGKLVIVPTVLTQDASAFYKLLQDEAVSVLNQTPSFMRQLLTLKEFRENVQNLPLRLIICGGEALPQELGEQLLDLGVDLWNFYGPTEATVWSLIKKVEKTSHKGGIVSIGQPIANTSAYILDENLRLAPIGATGELHLGGEGLAVGYFKRPDLNRERFIDNPLSSDKNSKLYKTGDLARRLPNGDFEYIARMDSQVKVRGFRIELGEIEQNIAQLSSISQNVVIVREDQPGDQRLCAYLVAKDKSQPLDVAAIRHHLKAVLPAYMVPQTFMAMDEFPLTPNGKIDRKNLPSPDSGPILLPTMAANAAQSETEKRIGDIWQDVLGLQHVGMDDNFFDVGGYSFLLVQVCNRLREEFAAEISVVDLFQYPTIRAIAAFIDQGKTDQSIDFNTLESRARKRRQGRLSRNNNNRSEQKV